MKIIISPSKTQNTFIGPSKIDKQIINFKLTNQLFAQLKQMSINEIQKLMKIKNALLEDTYRMYQLFDTSNHKINAISLYSGVVFEQLEKGSYNHSQNQYLNKHLVILSAMYGPLSPNTGVWPYRLDMTMKPNGINLYHYWQENIDKYFMDTDIIIDLASNEFSKMINEKINHVIHIDFKEENEKLELKTISYNAKKARGLMLNQMIMNQIESIELIKSISVEGYIFQEDLSDDKHLIFVKKYIK